MNQEGDMKEKPINSNKANVVVSATDIVVSKMVKDENSNPYAVVNTT